MRLSSGMRSVVGPSVPATTQSADWISSNSSDNANRTYRATALKAWFMAISGIPDPFGPGRSQHCASGLGSLNCGWPSSSLKQENAVLFFSSNENAWWEILLDGRWCRHAPGPQYWTELSAEAGLTS